MNALIAPPILPFFFLRPLARSHHALRAIRPFRSRIAVTARFIFFRDCTCQPTDGEPARCPPPAGPGPFAASPLISHRFPVPNPKLGAVAFADATCTRVGAVRAGAVCACAYGCVCVCVSVSVCVCLCLCVRVCDCVCLSVCLWLCACAV